MTSNLFLIITVLAIVLVVGGGAALMHLSKTSDFSRTSETSATAAP